MRFPGCSPVRDGKGAKVLVIGAGPLGLAAIYWARRRGASGIVAAARSSRKAEIAKTLGATAFVQQSDDLAKDVTEALGGAPDIVFECAGQPGLISQAVLCVRPRGTVVGVGMCFHPENFVSGYAVAKQIRMQFSIAYGLQDFRDTVAALDKGHVEPRAMITDTISLSALPAVFENLRTDKAACKILVDPAAA